MNRTGSESGRIRKFWIKCTSSFDTTHERDKRTDALKCYDKVDTALRIATGRKSRFNNGQIIYVIHDA